MRLARLARFSSLALLAVLVGGCQRSSGEVAAVPDSRTGVALAVHDAAGAESQDTSVAPPQVAAAASADGIVGRTLAAAKRLGIAFTSNVMGELEPCG